MKIKYLKKQYLSDPSFVLTAMFCLIIFIGVFLSVYQYLFNRSLWLDEASLALNIINKSYFELLKPLDFSQVAPILFLQIEKIFSELIPNSEFGLRLFPLISFLTSIPLFYLLSNKMVKNKVIALISTSIFSISLSLLKYSSEVKQYSVDVLFTIIILYCSLTLQLNKNKSLFIYAIIGSIAVWLSNVAIILLFVTGVYLLYFEGYKNKNYKIIFPFIFWTISFYFYYYLFIHNHPSKEVMMHYWENSFLPFNPFSENFYNFLFLACQNIYDNVLGFDHFWPIPFLISLSSIGFLFVHRKYTILYFCLSPIILHLLLSSFKLYPFSGRLILYILPLIILLFSIGLYYLFEFINRIIQRLPKLLLIFPVIIMFYPIYLRFPIEHEEIKKSLNYIEKNIKKDETIYVYYGAKRALDFYIETKFINIYNIIVNGTDYSNDHPKYDYELLNLKGKVWILFSHVHFYWENDNDEKYIVDFLIRNGSELLDVKRYYGSSVYYVNTKNSLLKTE